MCAIAANVALARGVYVRLEHVCRHHVLNPALASTGPGIEFPEIVSNERE